jgi:uncharacterized DUF497 family protein
VKISYDSNKRLKTIKERGLDFAAATEIFSGPVFECEDVRKDYGERRVMCFGMLDGRMVVLGYVERNTTRHIFSMRKANEKEQKRFKNKLG